MVVGIYSFYNPVSLCYNNLFFLRIPRLCVRFLNFFCTSYTDHFDSNLSLRCRYRLLARNYSPSEYSLKIRVIGSILSAVTSVVRISMNVENALRTLPKCPWLRKYIPVRYCTSATTDSATACAGHSQCTVQ